MSTRTFSAQASSTLGRAGQKRKRRTAKHVCQEALVPHMDWSAMGASDHFVQLYEKDTSLLDAVSRFIHSGLQAREAAVVIATRSHRHQLEARLRAQGVDLVLGRKQGQYIALDAAEILASIMVGGCPEAQCFADVLGGIMARAGSRSTHVRVFGEMVALLWAEGNRDAALRLEELWNELATHHAFSLFCAYPMRVFPRAEDARQFLTMCAKHSHVIPAESYTTLASTDERLRTIVHLQQQAQALENEIAARQQASSALEQRVLERTAALTAANVALRREIAARARTQDALIHHEKMAGPVAEPVRPPAVCAQTILIIDDEPGMARALTFLLRRDGHTVETAANGRLALAKCQERDYDMILCDLRMPELDGPGFYRELQRRGSSLCQRMLFLTGDTLDPEARAFLEQVALPHLHKPFTAAMIRKALLANMASLGRL